MPLRLDVRKKLSSRSDRVKCVDLHPTEDWMLAALYNGNVHIWNYETQQIAKTFEVCDLPVRAAKFVARKNWVLTGSDDMKVRVFNYNTLERVHQFDAHADYLRSLAVHPSSPFILTSSDDMSIKLWDWEKKWSCTQVFEGHTHYVMQVAFNPKDNNSFVSASLDRTLKVWQLGSNSPNFTLEGHEKGVNCVSYYAGGDKPYLISGADDRTVKIWDYQNKACVQTLTGHAHNIAAVAFHPELPIILSGSEDGTFRIWHANTYRLESTLNYGMERGWSLATQKGSNHVALGYDEGCVLIQLGREEPAMSMDSSGKILWAKHAEIQQANIKSLSSETTVKDGEALPLDFKDLGSSDLYPQSVRHNSNGRFVVVSGDGEYVVYTAMALRNKCFGSALEFVWSANDGNEYAIRENNSQVKIFKNFKEKTCFKPDFGAEGIFGGHLLGVKSSTGLAFYDWETAKIVRRIEISALQVLWNESGTQVCIATEDNLFILKYDAEAEAKGSKVDEDGIEDAFDVVGEVAEVMRTGVWVGDCFIYTNSMNRLNYFVGGEIVTVSHLDKVCYILGYLPKENRVFLGDKEMNVLSYSLLLSVMEYQTCVMRKDFTSADQILPTIPKEHRNRVAHFLEKQGFQAQALAVTADPEHQFDLALHLGDLKTAAKVAENPAVCTEEKWKQLAEVATRQCDFSLAQHCLHQAEDFGGLLLMASAAGNSSMVETLGSSSMAAGRNNIAFISYFILGKLDDCLEVLLQSNRLAEAAFFARTYLPSQISRVVGLWKESVGKKNAKAAAAIADPTNYENLFPGLRQSFQAENYLRTERQSSIPALAYPSLTPNEERDIEAEVAASLASGADLDSVVDLPVNTDEVTSGPVESEREADGNVIATVESEREANEKVIATTASPIVEAPQDKVVSNILIPTPPSLTPAPTAATTAATPPPEVVDAPVLETEEPLSSLLGEAPSQRPQTPVFAVPVHSTISPAVLEQPLTKQEFVDVCVSVAAKQSGREVGPDEIRDEDEDADEICDEVVAKEEAPVVTPEDHEEAIKASPIMPEVALEQQHHFTSERKSPSPFHAPPPPPIIPENKTSSTPPPLSSRVAPLVPIATSDVKTPDSAALPVSTPAFFQSYASSSFSDMFGGVGGSSDSAAAAASPANSAAVVAADSQSLDGVDAVTAPEVTSLIDVTSGFEVTTEETEFPEDSIALLADIPPPNSIAPDGAVPVETSLLDIAPSNIPTPDSAAPIVSTPAFFQSFASTPFNDLFDAAIETLKSEPEAKLDRLDPFGDAGVEDEVSRNPAVGSSEDAIDSASRALVDFEAPLNPLVSAPSLDPVVLVDEDVEDEDEDEEEVKNSKEFSTKTEAEIEILTAEPVTRAEPSGQVDPFDAWEEEEEVVAEAAIAPPVAALVPDHELPESASKDIMEDTKDVEDQDDWGDDAWGDDFADEDAAVEAAEAEAVVAAENPLKMRSAEKVVDLISDDELDLDLDDINLDNVDTTDLNLSDDLLSD